MTTVRYINPRADAMTVLAYTSVDKKFIHFAVLLRTITPMVPVQTVLRKIKVEIVEGSGDISGHPRWKLHHKIPVNQDPLKWLKSNGFGWMEFPPLKEKYVGTILAQGLNFEPASIDVDHHTFFNKDKLAEMQEGLKEEFPGEHLPSDKFIMDAWLGIRFDKHNEVLASEKRQYMFAKAIGLVASNAG